MPTRIPIRSATWLLVTVTTTGCYHQYLRVSGSDPIAEPERKTVYSYAWGLLHSSDSVAVCGETRAIDQIEVKSNFGMTMLGILSLGVVVPRRLVWHCSAPRECVDDIGLAGPPAPEH